MKIDLTYIFSAPVSSRSVAFHEMRYVFHAPESAATVYHFLGVAELAEYICIVFSHKAFHRRRQQQQQQTFFFVWLHFTQYCTRFAGGGSLFVPRERFANRK